jgi:hypothetical protein
MTVNLKTLAFCAAIVLGAAPSLGADLKLAGHRAIYDMKLMQSHPGSNIAALDGFMAVDFAGSSCEGYVQSVQLYTRTTDWNGREVTTDMRSSSWEEGAGDKFHFRSRRAVNGQESEAIEGEATRDLRKKSVRISLKAPAYTRLQLGGGVMFPTQHSIAIMNAAARGQFALQADLYDGLDKTDKFYQTTTIIGKAATDNGDLPAVPNAEPLNGMTYWPVTISYFDSDKPAAIVPQYEISYRLYTNGVSRKLRIDYGNFSVEGELRTIQFVKTADCGSTVNKPVRR